MVKLTLSAEQSMELVKRLPPEQRSAMLKYLLDAQVRESDRHD